jgi:hypothetical protein
MFKNHTQCCTYSHPQTNEPDTSESAAKAGYGKLICGTAEAVPFQHRVLTQALPLVRIRLTTDPLSTRSYELLSCRLRQAIPQTFTCESYGKRSSTALRVGHFFLSNEASGLIVSRPRGASSIFSGKPETAEKVAAPSSKRPSAAKARPVFNQLRTG